MHRSTVLGHLACGVMLALAACGDPQNSDSGELDGTQQEASAFNGLGTGGATWNGLSLGGAGWNGIGWNSMSWNGIGWNSMSWNGIGWNSMSWNGLAWGGTGSTSDCVPTPNSNSCTTLHDWVNHTDVNGNNTPGDEEDRRARVLALSYWVSCACPVDVAIPFSDTHGLLSTTFYGGLGLAPVWCGSDTAAVVPESERQIVSACLMARVNTEGKHFPLSLRSLEPGTALTTNERITHAVPLSWYFGDLWKKAHADFDATSPVSNDLAMSGGSWWNMERFSCSFNQDPKVNDQPVYGRSCDVSDCGGNLEFLGACEMGQKRLGQYGPWDPRNSRTSYYKAVPSLELDPVWQPGGLTATNVFASSGGTDYENALYRGHTWRVMVVHKPVMIALENPKLSPPSGIRGWSQLELGALDSDQSWDCADGPAECQGHAQAYPWTPRGQKLFGLRNNQAITINLTGNAAPPNNVAGDPNEPVTLAIRYSRPGMLGAGQCNPELGCAKTSSFDCASGSVGPNGCIGGTADYGKLKIYIRNNKPYNNNYALVHGSTAHYQKNLFVPTRWDTMYSTAYIYPVYMQDAAGSIPGRSDATPGVTYDTVGAKLIGETANRTDAPNLDVAYFLPGAPPEAADCKGPGGCWLFAGPNQALSLAQNAQFSYTSPYLPPGTYTFKLTNVVGDADLYVKANAQATTAVWDCNPYLGTNLSETCTISLTGRGGYISAMVRGYAANTTATLIGTN